jgi:cytochrome bd-type quinol oxidase subunit 1
LKGGNLLPSNNYYKPSVFVDGRMRSLFMGILKRLSIRKSVTIFAVFICLTVVASGTDMLAGSFSFWQDIKQSLVKDVFAEDEAAAPAAEEAVATEKAAPAAEEAAPAEAAEGEEAEEGEEEEAALDPVELLKQGYQQQPEAIANEANPNRIMINMDQLEVPLGKFPLFGVSNRDITWIMAALHILFASFILGCPLFIIVSEAIGAEKTPGVNRVNAILCTLVGVFAGSVVGMIGEVILEAHGAVVAVTYAGAAAGLVVSLMVISGAINDCNRGKMGLIVGLVVGAAVGGIMCHAHGAGAILGGIAGLIAGISTGAIMCAKEEPMLERLAHECMKVVAVCYSFTALTGGFFLIVLVAFFPTFITYLFKIFNNLVTAWYPIMFLIETVFMYLYYYLWDPLNNQHKKGFHILLGILLNIAGLSLLIIMDAPAAYQTSPTKIEGSLKGIALGLTEWQRVSNPTWWGLNFHRMVGNLTYGGFVVAFIGALMFMWSEKPEDKAYYDWQGYLGNALGLGFMLPLPAMGYILAKEVYNYDAAIGMYIMSDRLSMMMLMQGMLIGFLFVGANFYMYVSLKRVSGHEKYLLPMKIGFVLIFCCAAIWYSPRHFFATMSLEPGMLPEGMEKEAYLKTVELPPNLSIFALMFAKNSAATSMVFLSLLNYIIYRVACAKGKLEFGKVNPLSQYILVFLVFSDIWLMTWMGGIRSLARRDYHIYKVMKDLSVDAFTPTVAHSASVTTVIVWMFFAMITAIVWMQLKYSKDHGGH